MPARKIRPARYCRGLYLRPVDCLRSWSIVTHAPPGLVAPDRVAPAVSTRVSICSRQIRAHQAHAFAVAPESLPFSFEVDLLGVKVPSRANDICDSFRQCRPLDRAIVAAGTGAHVGHRLPLESTRDASGR